MRPRQMSDGLCEPFLGSPEPTGQRPPPSPVSPTFTAHQLDGNLKRAAEEATLKKIYSLPLTGLWCDECQAPAHGLPAAMVEAVRQEEHLIKSLHAIVTKLKLGRIAWNKLWCFDCNTPAHGLPTHLKGELVARCEEFHAVSHTEAAAPLPEKEALRRSKASSTPLADLSTFSSLTCPADTPPAPPVADAPYTSLTPPARPVLPPGGPPPEPVPSPAVHAQGDASPSFAVPPHALAQAPASPDFARSPMTKKKRPPSLLFVAAVCVPPPPPRRTEECRVCVSQLPSTPTALPSIPFSALAESSKSRCWEQRRRSAANRIRRGMLMIALHTHRHMHTSIPTGTDTSPRQAHLAHQPRSRVYGRRGASRSRRPSPHCAAVAAGGCRCSGRAHGRALQRKPLQRNGLGGVPRAAKEPRLACQHPCVPRWRLRQEGGGSAEKPACASVGGGCSATEEGVVQQPSEEAARSERRTRKLPHSQQSEAGREAESVTTHTNPIYT